MPRGKPVSYPDCPEKLTAEQVEKFRREGYLAFSGLLKREPIERAKTALTELVRQIHSQACAGSVGVNIDKGSGRGYTEAGIFVRKVGSPYFVQFEAGFDPLSADADEAELKIRKLMHFHAEHPYLKELSELPRMRGIVADLLGPEPILFQDTAFCKPPFIGVEKPWHQDNAYFAFTPLESVLGVWIALDQATVANGCMHIIPGGHLKGALRHFHGTDCEIVRDRVDVKEIVPIELEPGGVLIFCGMLPHQTPPNRSPQRRRSVQFHFRGANTREVTRQEYDQVFAESDGTPASCVAAG